MVRLTTSQNNDLVELRVEGELTETTTHEVEQLSRSHLGAGRKVILQLAGATFADRTGVDLLRDLQKKGVMLTECSGFLSELLRGKPEPSLDSTGERRNGEGLVERLKAHDEEAFETMVRQYGGRMLATARRLLGNEHDANDAVQQAFISVFKSIAGFNGEAKLSTWLHRIVVNSALAQMRYRRRRPELPIDDLLPRFDEEGRWASELAHNTEARENLREILTDGRETQEMVRRCIDRLPEVYRSVLVLRDIEELDTAEAAEMLAVTPNAAKIRLHRARQALKTLIERERCLL
jgi:RNA polymerase sigma-70 factor (ECF subfamily)